jgi:hypothetical protein
MAAVVEVLFQERYVTMELLTAPKAIGICHLRHEYNLRFKPEQQDLLDAVNHYFSHFASSCLPPPEPKDPALALDAFIKGRRP